MEHLLYSLSAEKAKIWVGEIANKCKEVADWLNDIQDKYGNKT